MAALVLSAAGAAAGKAVFGPAGAIAGRLIGALAGNAIDHALFGTREKIAQEGPRLADLGVMASTEGAPIPRVYGRARLPGQVIWATNLEEMVSTTSQTTGGGGKGMGGSPAVTTTTTTYSYFANLGVGLCEGTIGAVLRIWADGKPLDLTGVSIRIHPGDETQTPDPLIVAKDGDVPAYRGLAYVVFERLPLANFGNRIPQLSFELVRPVGRLEQMVRGVTLIPGTTEFGYAPGTVVQALGPGQSAPENRHITYAPSDVVAALDELQAVAPNIERVAIVVAWFGTDLRCGQCRIMPGVDNRAKQTYGGTWSVAGLDRAGAHLVSTIDGRPAFGGTPSDQSIRDLIAEIKSRGLKVTLYPFLMLDIPAENTLPDPSSGQASQPAYPWRGRITCDPAPGRTGSPDGSAGAATQVNAFFSAGTDQWNYRNFVLHYASLAASAGGVNAFLIGSELKSLTRVRSASGVYPAVTALAALAADVKAIVGANTAVTYGADWTEYGAHVVDDTASEVRFPLDALWASPSVDAVGVDYYAPLSDWRDVADQRDLAVTGSPYRLGYLAGNLTGGEAYDWFYANKAARDTQFRTAITDGLGKPWIFRQKDMWNFWSQLHYERVGATELAAPTAWVPQSKPIWLTEIGCPAVDKGANQPSVFPDPKSSEAGLPHYSSGDRDDLIQRRYIEAALGVFDPAFNETPANPVSTVYGGRMIPPDGVYVWTWDARPFPAFPAMTETWSDAANWETGHWVTGRFGSTPLDGLVSTILSDSGIGGADTSELGEGADGYVVDRPMTPRAMLDPLALAFAFDASEQDGALRFRQRGSLPAAELTEDDLVLPDEGAPTRVVRVQESELPREVTLAFTDIGADYLRGTVASRRLVGGSSRSAHADLAIVTNDSEATRRAEIWLQDLWAGRESAGFSLPPSKLALAAGDVIGITVNLRRHLFELQEVSDAESRAVRARSVDPEVFDLALSPPRLRVSGPPAAVGPVHALALDLPALNAVPPPVLGRLAVFADPWPGAVTVWSSVDGLSYGRVALALAPSIVGHTLDDLPAGPTSRWHRATVGVRLDGGQLASISDSALLAGANAAAVRRPDGAWEIIQFANAELIADNTYLLSRFLRGQAGTEWAIAAQLPSGAPFVLLDQHIVTVATGIDALERTVQLRIVASGRDHADPTALTLPLTPKATALRPLAPVHLNAVRAAGGVLFSWTRRTRIDGDSWVGEVPLGEDSEQYVLDILSGTAVVRTIIAATSSVLYQSADEVSDFGVPQPSLSIRVAQLSATVGRGFPAEATLHT
jgi:hypothetical protein